MVSNANFKRKITQREQYDWNKNSYHSLHIVLLFFFLLGIGLIVVVSASLQRQTVRQEAARQNAHNTLWALLPKSSIHHPLHIHRINNSLSPAISTQGLGFTPQQIHAAYNIPAATSTNGTIAIIDAYRAPSLESDLAAFNTAFNLPQCSTSNGCLTIHTQSGSPPPQPPAGTNWDIETTIDIEWAHAAAPNAKILLFQANSDTPQDLVTGVDFARNQPQVSAVSMSWVTQEFSSESQFESIFTSTHPVAFFAASGDQGTGENWPAASVNVISVGGTTLTLMPTNTVSSETAWNGSGGGQSKFLAQPAYQIAFGIPNSNGKRAIPDISLNADPNQSPYIVIVHGLAGSVGGTSVGTPIWAAMSVSGQQPITHDMLYQNGKTHYSAFYRDITQGANGSCGFICSAHAGYDYITGLGSPISLPQSSNNPTATMTPITSTTPIPSQTSTPSPRPSSSPTVTIHPSITHTPTTTIPPGSTTLSLTVFLHGIGKGGDNANASSGGNVNPLNTTREVTVHLFDTNNTETTTKQNMTYNPDAGNFTGTVIVSNVPNGTYVVKVNVDGFLYRQIDGIYTVTQGQNTTLLPVSLVAGDINNDSRIDLADYNILVSCFGSKQNTPSCPPPLPLQNDTWADLNDDGKVDGVDYNLFIRELSVQKGSQ